MGEQWATASTGGTASPDLVGRDVELARLREALDAASAGRGGVLVLVGEAGIGKSRLAQMIASEAACRRFAVLQGQATPAAAPAAYRPLAEALSSALRAHRADRRREDQINTVPGGGRLVEPIVEQADGEYTFRITESPLPLAEFVSTMQVRNDGEDGCVVEWKATFEPSGMSEAEVAEIVRGFFQAGLNAL